MTRYTMLELLLLRQTIQDLNIDGNISIVTDETGVSYDAKKIIRDYNVLAQQFLSPYVVSNPSKEV